MRNYIWKLLILVAVSSLALAGCGSSSSSSTPAPGTGTGSQDGLTVTPIDDGDENTAPGEFALPVAINDFNEIIGSAEPAAGATLKPAFWIVDDEGAATVEPAVLASLVPDGFAAALGLNNNGVIVGMAANASGGIRAVIWADSNANPTALQGLAVGAFAAAYGISESGRIVGEAENGAGLMQAVRWQRAEDGSITGPFALPGVPAGWEAAAYAINGDNTIAGELIDVEGKSQAVLWRLVDGVYARVDLPTGLLESDNFVAISLNNPEAGQPLLVVGEGYDDSLTGETRAVSWAVSGDTIVVTDLRGNDRDSSAAGINDAGRIIGWEESATGVQLATAWTGTVSSALFQTESQAFDINNNNLAVGINDGKGFVKKTD